MSKLVKEIPNVAVNARLVIKDATKQGLHRFLHPAKEAGRTPYFVLKLSLAGVSVWSGQQKKEYTATVFLSNDAQADAMKADLEAPDTAEHIIDRETGKVSTKEPMYGALHSIYIGPHTINKTVNGQTISGIVSSVDRWIFAGENAANVYTKVIEDIKKDPDYVKIQDTLDSGELDEETSQLGSK